MCRPRPLDEDTGQQEGVLQQGGDSDSDQDMLSHFLCDESEQQDARPDAPEDAPRPGAGLDLLVSFSPLPASPKDPLHRRVHAIGGCTPLQ